MSNIPKIVLSGGPSGGKSKAIKRLKPELERLGFNVYLLRESAEALISSGFNRDVSLYDFQLAIARRQLEAEEELERIASKQENPVIICDRGLMDCRVYLDDSDFARIKSELNLSNIDMRDRYDAVFHMNSTSSDESVKYKTGEIRTETREEARLINERSLRAWCGNPHYRFIPLCSTFDEKFELLLREVKAFLGVPKPLEIERKFLIKMPDLKELLSKHNCVKTSIEQYYMGESENRFRLRKRGENGDFIFIKTVKHKISETVREEVETRLSEDEFNLLLRNNIIKGSISKDRYCLMENGTYYEIDVFPFWKKQAYIEIELLDENEKIVFPDFIEVIREVTFDKRYKNSRLCNRVPKEDI